MMFQYMSYKQVRHFQDEVYPPASYKSQICPLLSRSFIAHQVRLLVMPASPSSGPARAGTGFATFSTNSLIRVSWRGALTFEN